MRTLKSAEPKAPSSKDVQEAQLAVRQLSRLRGRKGARAIRVGPEGEEREVSVTVPREAFELFLQVLGQMANGNAVTIVPVHAELTTQEAAEILNVSRPFLVGLLDQGRIPYRLVGTHRRVKMADLLKYKEVDDRERDAVLEELAAEAQKHGLGY
jgi:excisionase family DNA binding protein